MRQTPFGPTAVRGSPPQSRRPSAPLGVPDRARPPPQKLSRPSPTYAAPERPRSGLVMRKTKARRGLGRARSPHPLRQISLRYCFPAHARARKRRGQGSKGSLAPTEVTNASDSCPGSRFATPSASFLSPVSKAEKEPRSRGAGQSRVIADPELASYLRIEERELEAGGVN